MEHQELSPEARKALVQCYRLLYQWGREAMAAEARAQAEQSGDEARPDSHQPQALEQPEDAHVGVEE